ncbi:hypothetical protein L249_8623 [Ophiocordyceps polyrhachis-furcata BCC 54312]|uniref:Uncharacterized protein n=1 Tax=Ophiocordyceps polyrhachis-furcata BCC 54312 TaxID=1330021 RepID=A0A367L6X8_9HYPO|nr:hypothetical protein L249_8623 [Ophiocordyceps polyrhachis-furcata BCC 54312]
MALDGKVVLSASSTLSTSVEASSYSFEREATRGGSRISGMDGRRSIDISEGRRLTDAKVGLLRYGMTTSSSPSESESESTLVCLKSAYPKLFSVVLDEPDVWVCRLETVRVELVVGDLFSENFQSRVILSGA